MWIFFSDAYLSIVDKGDPSGDTLLVRARRKNDIHRVFPDAKVEKGGGTDYRYRARIDRELVAQRIAEAVRTIRYGNFKATVDESERHSVYMKVWSSMVSFQQAEQAKVDR